MTWARRDGADLVLEDVGGRREIRFRRSGGELHIEVEGRDSYVIFFARGGDAPALAAWLHEMWGSP